MRQWNDQIEEHCPACDSSIPLSENDRILIGYYEQLTPWLLGGAGGIGEEVVVGAGTRGAAMALAASGDHIVLGLRAFGLESTAARVGGRTLLSDPNWMQTLRTAISTPGTRFTVSVEGLTGNSVRSQVLNSVQRGLGNTGGYTDWELAQLYQAGQMGDVTFVNGAGQVLANPFK